MAYQEDLLRLALDLAGKGTNATQADLRRAVSTAYYALFHLLVTEATVNWRHEATRNALGRMFDHRWMRKASERVMNTKLSPFTGQDPLLVSGLRYLAETFVDLQTKRHVADYDNDKTWTPDEALEEVSRAESVFLLWDTLRGTDLAQDYLVSLLIRPRD